MDKINWVSVEKKLKILLEKKLSQISATFDLLDRNAPQAAMLEYMLYEVAHINDIEKDLKKEMHKR